MKYYIIAGEPSGDLHGAKLIHSLSAKDDHAKFRIWGGDQMAAASGETPQRHLEELSFMGFVEVLKHLPKILSNIRFCKEDILTWEPDVIIFIDFPGFNLRIAKWAKKFGFKTFYYIAPQVWAWKEKRVLQMKSCLDELFVILPFEKPYFQSKGLNQVHYFGHPLKDEVDFTPSDFTLPSVRPKIALLPGSRKQEINALLPLFLRLAENLSQCDFIIVKAPGITDAYYDQFLNKERELSNVNSTNLGTSSVMPKADAALVASGTATLETALYGVPQLVAYKTSWLTYQIAKRLVKVKYISLVNLIVDQALIKELIQEDCKLKQLQTELEDILYDQDRRKVIKEGYLKLSKLLGSPGSTNRVADKMIQLLHSE